MGTQQILLIVLSVIIVGIAVAVGITMFNAQAANSNRQAVIGDMNTMAASAMAYYKTPTTHGGGAGTWTLIQVGKWVGLNFDGVDTWTTGNGTYVASVSGDVLTIVGSGTETGNDNTNVVKATLTLTGATSTISTSIDN